MPHHVPHHGLPIRRLRLLIEQLIEEQTRKVGAQGRVSHKLGISEASVSKIRRELKHDVTAETLSTICADMRLDPAFFFDVAAGDSPSYRDFIRQPELTTPVPEPPHWAEFAASWERFGELTADEQATLRGMTTADHKVRSWTEWIRPAEWLLGLRGRS